MQTNKKIIRSSIVRYFHAVDVIEPTMLVEYCLELAGLPHDPPEYKDVQVVKRYARQLRTEGVINYVYDGDKYVKI